METFSKLLAMLWLGMGTIGLADRYQDREIQAPKPILLELEEVAEEPISHGPPEIPSNCRNRISDIFDPCQQNSRLEWLLEREYWEYIGNLDFEGMKDWLKKAKLYKELSNTHNRGRIAMLSIFGNLFVYSSGNMFNPLRSNFVTAAFQASNEAVDEMPRSPNAWAFFYAIRNFTQFTLGQKQKGLESLAAMQFLEERYGNWGTAGPLGAVVHLMGAADPELVELGLRLHEECLTTVCGKRTSIAPFQRVGAAMIAAEAYGYLGKHKIMGDKFSYARDLGRHQGWPFLDEVDRVTELLVKPDGLLETWEQGKTMGEFRSPLGPAHQPIACAYCHVGADVPQHYYP